MKRNMLKIRILSILADQIERSYLDVLLDLGGFVYINPSSVQMALMRYYRHGLLERRKRGSYYLYCITEKGIGRLDWLKSTMIERN